MKVFFLIIFFLAGPIFSQTRPDALVEFRNGNFERAVEICRDEITVMPNNMDSYVVLCWSLISLGRYREAMTYAQAGRNVSRFDPRIIQIIGEIHYYEGRNTEALHFFQEYIDLAPQGQRIDRVYYFIGEIFIRQGRFRHADIALTTAVHWVPGNANWWTRLAYARENAGDLSDAASAYNMALTLNSQLVDAR